VKPQPLHTAFGDDKVSFVPGVVDEDGSTSKYEVHLNVNSLNGCFFNFGSSSSAAPNFPFSKE
jgi:hypothetical protein